MRLLKVYCFILMGLLLVNIQFAFSSGPSKTIITGNRMEVLEKGDVLIFEGNVRVRRGTDELRANIVKSYEKEYRIEAYGKVKLERYTREGEKWEIWGDRGIWSKIVSSGTIWGDQKQVRILRTLRDNPDDKLKIKAWRLDIREKSISTISEGTFRATAWRNVYIVHHRLTETGKNKKIEETKTWSRKCHFEGDLVTLTGGFGGKMPRVLQIVSGEKRYLTGERIIYDVSKKSLVAEGQAKMAMTKYGDETNAQE